MLYKQREKLEKVSTYQQTKTIEQIKQEYKQEKVLKLAGNENTMGVSPLVKEAIKSAENELFLYPDAKCQLLREALSNLYNVQENQLIFGNGSFELITLIGQTFIEEGDVSLIPSPSFGWYKNVTLTSGGTPLFIPLAHHKVALLDIKEAITPRTKVIWLCNPNNPTGTHFSHEELENFLNNIRKDIVVVLDEAYYEYAAGGDYPNSVDIIQKYSNVIILRTFSKVYGLASLRIGYGIGNQEMISMLDKVRIPVNINKLAQVAAYASLQDEEFKRNCLENNAEGLAFYEQQCREEGWEYIPSKTNFITMNVHYDAKKVVEELMKRGISIRPGADFGMDDWIRITIGREAENQFVVRSLKEIIRKFKHNRSVEDASI
jgi:histidinol-phosphate aminotransferase